MKRLLLILTILASALSSQAAQTQLSALVYAKQDGTDQTTNIQRAINLAVSSQQTLYVPPNIVFDQTALTNLENLMVEDYTIDGFKRFLGAVQIQPPTSAAITNYFGASNVTQLVHGFIKTRNSINGPMNVQAFEVDGASDDTLQIQAAVDAAPAGATIYFPPRVGSYNFTTITITQNNLTIDCGQNLLTNSVTGAPLFRIMPRSLFISNRLTGADYPVAWHTGGGAPTPVDGDFETMMYESNPALRVTNIVFKNARTLRDGNLVRAYSVDGLEIRDCVINPPNNGSLRLFHCSNVQVHDNHMIGGAGSYTVFFFKCDNVRFYNNFVQSQAERAVSFKGARHPDNLSIFAAINPTNTYASQPIITGNTIWFDRDGIAVDWPPDPADDVGDAFGVTIGFNKGQWYGRFKAPEVGFNNIVFKGTYANGRGRGLWTSFPHKAPYVHDNNMLDAGFFGAGLSGAVYKGNLMNWTRQSANAFFFQTDTATATDNSGIAVLNNVINDYYAAGTGGTDPEVMLLDGIGFTVRDNIINGLSDTIVNVVVTSDPTDQSIIERNRLIFDSAINANPNFIIGTFPNTNNVHGLESDNVRMDSATGTISTVGVKIVDNAAGSGLRIYSKGNYAGIGFMQRVGTAETYLGQIYEDLSATNLVIYHNTAPRLTIKEDGSSEFFSYATLEETAEPVTPPADKAQVFFKDDGFGQTAPYYKTSDGVVHPFGTTGTNGGVFQLGPFVPLRIPVANGTNTLTDGPLSIPSAGSTNVILDGQIHFHSGNAVSNSLTRVSNDLVYTNDSTSGSVGPGLIVQDSGGRQASLRVNSGTAAIQGLNSVDLNSTAAQVRLGSVTFSPFTEGLALGTLNGTTLPWGNIVSRGTIYNFGFPATGGSGSGIGTDYSRLAVTHTGTNGFIILDSQALGSAGNPRPLRLNFGGTNYFEYTYDNGATTLPRFAVKDAPGTSYIRMQLTGGVVPTIDGSTSIAFSDDVVTKNIATDTDNTYDIGSTGNNGAFRDTYFKGSQHAVGANDGVGNYTWLAIRHTGNSGAIEFASEAGGTGVVRPISFTNAPVILHGFTKVQKAALTPVEGMLVFQTDNTPGLRVYQSGAWVMISTVADP